MYMCTSVQNVSPIEFVQGLYCIKNILGRIYWDENEEPGFTHAHGWKISIWIKKCIECHQLLKLSASLSIWTVLIPIQPKVNHNNKVEI